VLQANPAFHQLTALPLPIPPEWRLQKLLTRAAAIFYETQLLPVLLLRGALKEIALDLVLPSGERIPVLLNATLRRDSSATPTAIDVVLFEARERRLYERELLQSRRSAEQMAEVVRRSSDAIITLAADGAIQSWNSGAEQTFAYTSAEVVDQSFFDLLFTEASSKELHDVIQLLRRGQDVNRELCGRHKDGRELDLSISLTPHMEAPGILVAFSAIVRDVSSRRQAERALIQSEKLASVGRLASSIAHEINNPLEAVTNLLYILDLQVVEPENKELVRLAQEELARVSQIVTHTLRFHKQNTNRTELDLGALFSSVLGLYRARLENSGIKVNIERSDASPLLCYEGELRQILVNLVGNAFDAMRPTGGRLILRHCNATHWSTGHSGLRITIADTGSGIDPATFRRIFEAFFTTKGIAGTGLGLWITRDLVDKNRGHIRIRSKTAPGPHGTIVTLWFPHTDTPAVES
jgi:PAS domain S-box-containing protein